MKTSLLILLSITSHLFFAQSNEKNLFDIENKYQLIRELVENDSFRQYYSDYTDEELSEKGTVSFYYNGNELKHVFHIYIKGNTPYKDEYYIWDEELIFLHTSKISKEIENSISKQEIEKHEEYFYFSKEEAIKCLSKNSKITKHIAKSAQQKIQTKNEVVICDRTEQIFERYSLLLEYQKSNVKKASSLPKSNISKKDILDKNSYYIVSF